MKRTGTGFLIPLFLLMHVSLPAQPPWTLQQCIDRALDFNISIKLSELSNELNRNEVQRNTASFFPSLNGSASHNYFYGRSIDPYTNTYTTSEVQSNSFSLSSNVALFQGFQLQNLLKQSKLTYLSSQNELKKIQNDISISVVNFYLQVLYNDELITVTREQVNASTLQRDRMKRMFELGSVNRGSYLEMEAQLATDEVRLIQAQSQFDQSVLSLTQLLELDTVKNFIVERPEVVVPGVQVSNLNVETVYASALQTQPEIKSSEYSVLSAEKGLSVARGDRYPRLYMNGALSTNYSTSSQQFVRNIPGPVLTEISGFTSSGDTVYSVIPTFTPEFRETPFSRQLEDNLGKSFGFTLQLPIFNGWSTRTNIRRAEISLEQTRLNHQLTLQTLYKSVQQAVADAISSYRQFMANERNVEALEQSFAHTQESFNLGLISTYDFLQVKNSLALAQADLLQSKYEYIFRLKIIDFYQGKPLTF